MFFFLFSASGALQSVFALPTRAARVFLNIIWTVVCYSMCNQVEVVCFLLRLIFVSFCFSSKKIAFSRHQISRLYHSLVLLFRPTLFFLFHLSVYALFAWLLCTSFFVASDPGRDPKRLFFKGDTVRSFNRVLINTIFVVLGTILIFPSRILLIAFEFLSLQFFCGSGMFN